MKNIKLDTLKPAQRVVEKNSHGGKWKWTGEKRKDYKIKTNSAIKEMIGMVVAQ